ncbi:MAG: hypothetical protein ABL977_06990 [Candidatus Eisenbacteria bacterium]
MLSRKKKQLTELFLASDDEEPKVFDPADREALAVVVSIIVDVDFAFRRLAKLKSERARWGEWTWATTMISANMDSIMKVKWTIESCIAGCKVDRSKPLPKSLAELEREHRKLFELVGRPGGDDNERARRLIRILQLELIWFGQMW